MNELRSLLPVKVNIMALTATATSALRMNVSRIIGMKNELIISKLPCKENAVFSVTEYSSIEETFLPIAEKLCQEEVKCPRIIIFCRNYKDCADLYYFFKDKLGSKFTYPPRAPDLPQFRLVDMYMSCTEEAVKDKISYLFTRASTLRVVIATIAFALGVDCSDVRQVVSFGLPRDIESYIQETGRAGRDDLPSLATLIRKPTSGRIIESSMREYATNKLSCRRDVLYSNFDGYEHIFTQSLCMCCDLCSKLCDCNECAEKHNTFVFLKK